jgi:hypothetical protein
MKTRFIYYKYNVMSNGFLNRTTNGKYTILVCLLILSGFLTANAQRPLEVIINFSPPYPREFTAYYNNPQNYSITVINHSEQDQTVYFLGELIGLNNGVIIRTLPSFRADQPVTIPTLGIVTLTGEELSNLYGNVTIEDLEIQGIPPQDLNINGMLPEGEYIWCINAYDFDSDLQPLSIGCTEPFDIYYSDQLFIMLPFEEEVVSNDVFSIQWNPNITDPGKRDQLEYELKMIDLTENPESDLDLLFMDGGAQSMLDKLVDEELYIYNSDGTDFELTEGHQYAIRVRAIDPFNEVPFVNNGYSEIRTFWYMFNPNEAGGDEETAGNPASDCFENCNYTQNISTNSGSTAASMQKWDIGFFEMKEIEISSNNGGVMQGEASISIPWLSDQKIAVTFHNIRVNSNGRVYEGYAKAKDESNSAYDLGDVYNTLFVGNSECPSPTLAALSDEISSARSLFNLVADQPTGVPLGINQTLEGRQFTLGILDMKFEKDRASIALINILELKGLAENFWISIAGNDICLTPGGIGGEYILYQAFEKRGLGFGNLDIKTYGGLGDDQTIKDNYCYIEMNCEGMKSMAIRGEIAFNRNTIVPDDDGNITSGKAKGRFSMTLDKRNDPNTSLYAYNDDEAMTGTHLMFGFDMDPFQITGLEGWTFTPAQDAFLDLSDLENPADLVFPEGYNLENYYDDDSDLTATWQGIFIKNVEIQSPKEFSNGTRRGAFAQNFIFDPLLTVDIGVTGLLQVGDGNISGWGFSIDTFKIEIVQNTFISGGLYGGINPPVTGDGDYLKYRAVLDKNDNDQFSFYAIALPDSLISVPLAFAKAALCPNSYVHFITEPGKTEVSTFLKGQLVIDVMENLPAALEIPDVIPGLVIRLADFQLNYNSTQGFVTEDMVQDGTHSSFGFGIDLQDATCGNLYTGPIAEFEGFEGYEYDVSDLDELLAEGLPSEPSMQENVDGFPISINDLELGFSGNNVSLDFDIDVSLSVEMFDIMLGARINLLSNLQSNNKGIDRFMPDGIRLECARFGGADNDGIGFDPFVLRGEVCLANNDDGSKSFNGDIDLTIGPFSAALKAGFGKYGHPDDGEFGSRKYYGYWYFDGMYRLSLPLPLPPAPLPVVNFCGLGGGVYWNCTAPDVIIAMDEVTSPEPVATGIEWPEPFYGNRVLKFSSSWNLISDQVFMADPFIAGQWNTQSGLTALSFGGDFWSMALSYATRSDARLYGRSNTTLTFNDSGGTTKVAVLGENVINANIIPGILYGAGLNKRLLSSAFAIGPESEFPAEPSNNDQDDVFWFFNAGNPYIGDFGGVVFDLPGFNLSENKKKDSHLGIDAGVSAQLYTMVGQNIPDFLPEPPGIVGSLFGAVHSEEGSFEGGSRDNERDASQSSSGQGIVLGAHVTASCEIKAIFYAGLSIFAGMDLMLVKMDGQSCYTSNGLVQNPGVNGWYGTGRAYAGIEGAIGVKGKILGKEVDVKIIQLIAAMMVSAGGPDPMWLDGRATLQYNILGGVIKGSTRMMISVGEKCVPPSASPFDFPIIADCYPNGDENRNIDPMVRPSVSFTVPMDEWISVVDVKGKVHEMKPVLEVFTLKKECDNCSDPARDEEYDLISDDSRSASYKPLNILGGINGDERKKEYEMRVVVKALERKDGVENYVKWNGSVWKEDTTVLFKTGHLPYPMSEDLIGKTKPITNQKFYLQNEDGNNHYLQTQSNIDETYYYTEDTDGKTYDYFAVYKDNQGGEIFRQNIQYDEAEMKLKWNKPVLENNKEYIVQIVRKLINATGVQSSLVKKTLVNQNLLASFSTDSLSFQYQVEAEVPELTPMTTVGNGEILLHSFSFETSRFNTLNEKMQMIEVDVEEKNGYQRLNFSNFEGFDKFDINGFKMNDEDRIDKHKSPPRIEISDPFTAAFHNNISKPKLGNFATTYKENFEGEETGCETSAELNNQVDIQIGQTQGSGISNQGQISTNENQNNNQSGGEGSETQVPLLFPNLPSANFRWYDVDDLYMELNEFAIDNTIIGNDDEDDPLFIQFQSVNSANTVVYSNDFSLKFYVLEDVLADAQEYADFGEQWLDIVSGSCDPPTGSARYSQTLSGSQVDVLLNDLEQVTTALLNSNLIQGSGQNGFSNKVRFRYNKSFDVNDDNWGTNKNVEFSVVK